MCGDTKLNPWDGSSRHMTPREIAEFMLDQGATVGLPYNTYRDVWNAKDSERVVGLLELILLELRKPPPPKVDYLAIHRIWLQNFREQVLHLIRCWDKHITRISQLVDIKMLPPRYRYPSQDLEIWRYWHKREYLAKPKYAGDYYFPTYKRELRELDIIVKIKTVDDLIHLNGIGPGRLAKIKALTNGKAANP